MMNFTKRHGVAPVIATLLMVAIAVVGGMLIFVFAQDFFAQSDMMSGPTIEQVQIFGYDARDVAASTIENHEGDACTSTSSQDSVLGEDEVFAVYVRNRGAQDVIIEEVTVYGNQATKAAAGAVALTLPAAGLWTVVTNDDCTNADSSPFNAIGAGKDATIVIGFDSTNWGGDVKVGRPIFIGIETGAGNVFTKQIINGRAT